MSSLLPTCLFSLNFPIKKKVEEPTRGYLIFFYMALYHWVKIIFGASFVTLKNTFLGSGDKGERRSRNFTLLCLFMAAAPKFLSVVLSLKNIFATSPIQPNFSKIHVILSSWFLFPLSGHTLINFCSMTNDHKISHLV